MAKQSSKATKRAPKSSERTEKRLTFREATRLALDLYHETFRDLARYDREEKPTRYDTLLGRIEVDPIRGTTDRSY